MPLPRSIVETLDSEPSAIGGKPEAGDDQINAARQDLPNAEAMEFVLGQMRVVRPADLDDKLAGTQGGVFADAALGK